MAQTPAPSPTPEAFRSTQDPSRRLPEPSAPLEPITQEELAPVPGTVTWQGRYTIGMRLGEGGMGVVHEAEDLLLGRLVAVKELRRAKLRAVSATLLAREARALAAVDHPCVIRVHSVYLDASPPFLVMERARGRSLFSILAEGRLTLARSLNILEQIAAGLDALHAAGIVHGDVKPANVIVDDENDDRTKLIDAGLAPFLERMRPGEVLGTPLYMAPERATGASTPPGLAARGDVYSLAVLAFEMLTGRLPFVTATTSDLLRAHATQRPPMPSYVAGLSTEFDAPIARALAKSPEKRTSTCMELVRALVRASKGCDVNGRRLRVLVADDDEGQRMLLMSVLGAYLPGASVVLCGSGSSVLEAIAARPSVAVLDLAMPAPSGIELVRRVRDLSPGTAIVIVTGGGSGAEREAARALGVKRFLVKPFEVDELVQAIREAIDREVPAVIPLRRGGGGGPSA